MMKFRKKTLFRLIPVVLMLLAAPVFNACSPGGDAGQPTGPDSEYDPTIDFPRAGISLRVSPKTVTVPDAITGGSAEASVVATYRNSDGMAEPGAVINFTSEEVLVVALDANGDPVVVRGIGYNPSAVTTDSNGIASTTVFIHQDVPPGSYQLTAYTTFIADALAEGNTTLYVNEEVGERIEKPVLVGEGSGLVNTSFSFIAEGPTVTNLGNQVCYQFDFGDGVAPHAPEAFGVTRVAHEYNREGVYLARVRGVKCSNHGLVSEWSDHKTITIGTASN